MLKQKVNRMETSKQAKRSREDKETRGSLLFKVS